MSPLILGPVAAPSGVLRYEWVDPEGIVRDLTFETSPSMFVSRGTKGLGVPGVELRLEKLPQAAGSAHRYTATQPREIELPISVQAASFVGRLTAVESLRGWFRTGSERSRTPGYLRITRPHDDGVRQIACLYAGGLEGDMAAGSPSWEPLVVSLVAPDPTWTAVDETAVAYSTTDVGDDLSILNLGDFDAYPIWTIDGPASAITISNTTTGKAFALTANSGITLTASDTLIVDTRPPSQRTMDQVTAAGFNLFNRLTPGSSLWWLVPGQNHFTITASGTTGATTITLAWLPRYEGAL